MLVRVFGKYPSFQKAKVVRDKRTNKTKGFGFVSFKDPQDFIKAMKEMNGKSVIYIHIYIFRRPYIAQKSFFSSITVEIFSTVFECNCLLNIWMVVYLNRK